MPRQDVNQEINTFVGGILTEANPINYPAGFSLDQENFLGGLNGTNRKRYGVDADSVQTAPLITSLIGSKESGVQNMAAYVWPNANNTTGGKQDILVTLHKGSGALYLIDDSGEITANWLGNFSDAKPTWASTPFKSDFVTSVSLPVSFNYSDMTSGNDEVPGVLVRNVDIAGGVLNTFQERRLLIRDFEGLDDGLVVTQRPNTLVDNHHYNLLNQGWTEANIQQFFTDTNVYPSNADNMNSGIDAATGAFNSSWVTNANAGSTKVKGGRSIISPASPTLYRRKFLDIETSFSGATFFPGETDDIDAYISSVSELFGRLFFLWSDYKGVSVGGSSKLMYSQIDQNLESIANCHTINDTTSRDFNQTLPTDGGYIDISNMGSVFKLVPLKTRLLIFSDSGIYELFNAQDFPSPASFNIRKISDVVVSHVVSDTFKQAYNPVVAEDNVFFLASSGAYVITASQAQEESLVTNISDTTIQSLLDSYPPSTLANAQGAWSSEDRSVHWLLNTRGVAAGSDPTRSGNLKDTELIFNATLKAWTKNKYSFIDPNPNIPTFPDPEIPPQMGVGLILPVELPPIAASNVDGYPIGSRLRYIGIGTAPVVDQNDRNAVNNNTVYKPILKTYQDYGVHSGVVDSGTGYDYTAFIQTGYINLGDSQRQKQSNYILPSFLRTEDGFTDDGMGNLTPTNESSCVISAWWDYVDDATAPKVNPPFEAYRYNRLYIPADASDPFNFQQSVLTTKNRLTGRGRALSLRFESGAGKDCQLLGWGMDLGINRKV